MIRSNRLADSVGDVLSDAVQETDGDVLLVNPSRACIRQLVSELRETSDPPGVRLFADEGPLKDLMDDFLIASAVADFVESDALAVRTLESVPNNTLLVSRESVVSLVAGGDGAAGLTTTDASFVADTFDRYDRRWDDAPPFTLRTPPLSTVLETLEADIGPTAAGDFQAVLDSLDQARGDGGGLDEVTISLLVAARNGELLYDISKWGEDVGLASKATFSRTKTALEEAGLVDTEKVPIDVGRPRLRLMLGDDRLDTSIDEFADIARRLLA